MASQCDRILQYMRDYGSITAVEAMENFGCQRLAARVSDLRSKGFPVVAHLETGKNRYGSLSAMHGTDWRRSEWNGFLLRINFQIREAVIWWLRIGERYARLTGMETVSLGAI